ncbi:sodium:proton antiporter [Planctobacterium marinum]|uniref:Sodium:proton antiporter n=1 Tax=Planctobacterium marinum TaxID=1631968 RepID=A0AA48HLR8_9ALTE|nr:sodium:proton antiporter [Planctobacterium marinum]
MTYINSMMERDVFNTLRHWLTSKGFTYRSLFWVTGILAFVISPIADNLTTALILCAVIMTVASDRPGFIVPCSINIVVAANSGGAFSPFGDITTLMVWQKGVVPFTEFGVLFLPSLVNYLVPAFIMQFAVPIGRPQKQVVQESTIQQGGMEIVLLFLLTIITAIAFHHLLAIPPVYGMLLGLAYLKLYGFWLRTHSSDWTHKTENPPGTSDDPLDFDVFAQIAHAEWDTLFFFYGVIMSVGGLTFIGYMELLSVFMYQDLGTTQANILVGVLSAFVDNIPVMFSVLAMEPEMSQAQWLLVTLSAGVGGSMLSIGSAAGVALMGQTRGIYTFLSHLKWTPVIALGFVCSIALHMWLHDLQL